MNFLSIVFAKFPESKIKNYIRCYLYNRQQNLFKIQFEKGCWVVSYNSFSILFKYNPFHNLITNYLFLRNFNKETCDIIVDAGGFEGTFSIFVSKLCPKARVYVFEPDPINFARLKENVQLNSLRNIFLERKGIWESTTELKFASGESLSSSLYNSTEDSKSITIEVVSLDNYFKEIEGKNVFVKMNIEGAEINALEGTKQLIKKNSASFAIATNHRVEGEYTYFKIEQAFKKLDISYKTIIDNNGLYITTYAPY